MDAFDLGLQAGHELFEGENYCMQMSILIGKNCVPWGTSNFITARDENSYTHPLWHHYIDTDFGIAGTKENIYLIPHSLRLRITTANTSLIRGGIPLVVDEPSRMKVYNRKSVITGRDLTENEAHQSPLWLEFADRNQSKLDTFVEKTFRFGRDKFGHRLMMGISVPKDPEPMERGVIIRSLNFRSRASGYGHSYSDARLVGMHLSTPQVHSGRRYLPYSTSIDNGLAANYDTSLLEY